MKVRELISELEAFQGKLIEHQKLWSQSINRTIPQFPEKNVDLLKEQSRWLSRKLGAIRRYLELFNNQWIMQHPATGITWDVLDSAVGLSDVAQKKGASLRTTIEKLDQILGNLESLPQEQELSNTHHASAHTSSSLDSKDIHPKIKDKCALLYAKGTYAEAVEKSFKVVRDRLRELTGHEKGADAFGKGSLYIHGAVAPHVDEDFNSGVKFLLMSIDMFRNEKSHTSDGKIEDPIRAYQYLSLSSLAMYLLENAGIKKGGC